MATSASQPTQRVQVKAKFGEDFRRHSWENREAFLAAGIDGLVQRLRAAYRLPPEAVLTLTYCDEEGDPCGLTNAHELSEALRHRLALDNGGMGPLRLELALVGAEDHERNGSPPPTRTSAQHAGGMPPRGVKREAPVLAGAAESPPRARPRIEDTAAAAEVWARREERRHAGNPSPWLTDGVPQIGAFVLLRLVSHKTKVGDTPDGDDDSAEADQLWTGTSKRLDTPSKVAAHLRCKVHDLLQLNRERYPEIRPSSKFHAHTALLQPFRPRDVKGVIVAHTPHTDGSAERTFRIVALDVGGINMPPCNPDTMLESTPDNTFSEYSISAECLRGLPKVSRGGAMVYGPVRLDPEEYDA